MCEKSLRTGLILIVCMTFRPVTSYAQFAGGTGEPNDPYQIATAEQLISIGSDRDLMDKNFVLVADIDMDPNLPGGRVFTNAVIAQDSDEGVGGHSGASFEGVFDGAGHTIANLHIEGVHGFDAGLFGKLSGLVKDVNLTDVAVSGSPCGAIAGLNHRGMILRCQVTGGISGADDVGGIVGSNWNGGLMDCRAQVQVTGDGSVGGLVGGGPGGSLMNCRVQAEVVGDHQVGGLVGRQGHGTVLESHATGSVIGNRDVGGLIGITTTQAIVLKCSANCEVIGEHNAGGLIGNANLPTGPLIANSYARGSVAGSVVGGLAAEAGQSQFLNCYAACRIIPLQVEGERMLVGGLFGDVWTPRWAPIAVACFWDAELSGIAVSSGSHPLELGAGLTTEQMLEVKVFRDAGWDFAWTWTICEGDYPTLQWQTENCGAESTVQQ